ncbi:MAG: PilZ domain-containing protein [Pseudomonadota bacterium]
MTDLSNRSSERVRTLRAARIVWDNAQRTINCTIRDMSRTGARLELSDMTALPETFDIQVPPAKDLRPVQVMRRSGRMFGVMFLDIPFSDNVTGADAVSKLYNPKTGEHPAFAPLPELVRDMLPWAA